MAKWPYRGWGIREIGIYLLCWGTLVPDDDFGKMTILGIYRLYQGTLVPDDDFGKITIYKVFISCTGVPWYLMMILEK